MPPKPPSSFQMEQAMSALMSARARMWESWWNEEGDPTIDDEEAKEEFASVEGNAIDLLHAIIRAAIYATDMAKAADERAKAIIERRDRYKRRAEALRGAAFAAMDVLELKRCELPDLLAVVAAGQPSVIYTNEERIPAEFRIPQPDKIDKAGISAALKNGHAVEGAELRNGLPTLQIRTK